MATKTFYLGNTIKIVNGPSKFDFMLSNFDFKKIEITIINAAGQESKVTARINFAWAEDGSKNTWIGMIELFVYPRHPDRDNLHEKRAYYYNSNTRTGTISEAGARWELVHS